MNLVDYERSCPAAQPHIDPRMEPRELEIIRKIEESIAYMMQHLDGPLQASTLAAQANISLSHYFTLFKRHVGSTPMDYFIRLRLRRACHLLENTELSIKAIAYTLGYEDPYYFSRIFKSFHQIAPSRYRLLKIGARKPAHSGARKTDFPRATRSNLNASSRLRFTSSRQPSLSAALKA